MPTSAAREPRTATTMFVHDFAAVPGAVEEAVRKVSARTTSPKLEEIVCAAWNSHSQILTRLDPIWAAGVSATRVCVELDSHRLRGDTGIINLRWSGDGWLPSLDADLELAAFGPDCTHLHLLGRYELPSCTAMHCAKDNMRQRVMVSVVRQFLTDFRALLGRST